MARITVTIILKFFIMDNIFSLKIIPEGLDKATQASAAIDKVGEATNRVNAAVNPLGKIINILERIEKVLLEIGKVGVESFNKLDEIAKNSQQKFKDSADKADKLEKEITDIGNASKKAGANVKGGLLDNLAKFGLAFQGIQSVAQTIGGFIAPAFAEGMSRETASVNFATLLRDDKDTKETATQKGKQFADDLRNSTAAALYGTSTINDAAKNMLSFGIDGSKTQTVLAQIGDIAAGDAQKFGSLSLAFAQISSAGKLQGQDLMQLINAGFNPLAEISKKTGKSIGELKDEMAKGAISAQMVEDAFASATSEGGQFHGMLEDIKNNTMQGKMAMLSSAFDDLKAKLFELLVPIVEKILPVITDQVLPAIMSVAEFLAPVFDLIADNIDTVGVFIGVLGTLAAVCGVVNAVMAANPIALIVIGIAALIALIYKVIDAYDRWGAALTFILGPLGLIINVIMTIKRYWDDIVSAFQNDGIIAGLKRIGVCILDMVLYPVQQLLGWVAELTGWDWAKKAQEYVNGFRDSIDAINPEDAKKTPDVVDTPNDNGTQHTLENAVNSNTYTKNGGGDLTNATKQGAEAVASGGTRNTQITITLGNMVETVNFNGTPQDNAQETVDTFTTQLLRVLYSAQTAV